MKSLSHFSPRAIDAMGLAACLAITLIAYLAGVRPALDHGREAERLKRELAARRAEVAELESISMRHRAREAAYRGALGDQVLHLEPLKALNARLGRLTAHAQDAGLRIDRMQPDAGRRLSHFVGVPIRVAGFGSFPAIVRYLRTLELEFEDVRLSSFDAVRARERGRSGESGGGAEFTIELTWIAMPER